VSTWGSGKSRKAWIFLTSLKGKPRVAEATAACFFEHMTLADYRAIASTKQTMLMELYDKAQPIGLDEIKERDPQTVHQQINKDLLDVMAAKTLVDMKGDNTPPPAQAGQPPRREQQPPRPKKQAAIPSKQLLAGKQTQSPRTPVWKHTRRGPPQTRLTQSHQVTLASQDPAPSSSSSKKSSSSESSSGSEPDSEDTANTASTRKDSQRGAGERRDHGPCTTTLSGATPSE